MSLATRLIGTRRLLMLIFVIAAPTVAVLAASGILLGSYHTAKWVLGGGDTVVVQQGSRTVFSSRVRISLADALSASGVKAEPQVILLTEYRGGIVVVRGVEDPWSRAGMDGSPPPGPYALVGSRAANRLKLSTGSTFYLASPTRRIILRLPVVGIYRMNGPLDDEVLVPLKEARMAAGIPSGLVSAIVVHGMDRGELADIISSRTVVRVSVPEQLRDGMLAISDSRRTLVAYAGFHGRNITVTLPLGIYTFVVYKGVLMVDMGTRLASGGEISISAGGGSHRLIVLTQEKPKVSIGGRSLEPEDFHDGSWTYILGPGIYTVRAGGREVLVPLVGDTTVSLRAGYKHVTANVSVLWRNGSPARDFLIQVERDGVLVASMISKSSRIRLALEPGTYKVKIVKPPFTVEGTLRAPGSLTLTLPWISGSIPASKMAAAVAPTISSPEESLSMISGLSVHAIFTALSAAVILSALAALAASRLATSSMRTPVAVLRSVGASPRRISLILLPAVASAYVAAASISLFIFTSIYPWLYSGITVLGHSIDVPFVDAAIIAISVDAAGLSLFIYSLARGAFGD